MWAVGTEFHNVTGKSRHVLVVSKIIDVGNKLIEFMYADKRIPMSWGGDINALERAGWRPKVPLPPKSVVSAKTRVKYEVGMELVNPSCSYSLPITDINELNKIYYNYHGTVQGGVYTIEGLEGLGWRLKP